MKMHELFIGLVCFMLGMLVMYIYDQREYQKLCELSEETFKSTFNSIFEIFKLVGKDNKDNDDLWWENLTWKCEVCRQERPDDKISVMKFPSEELEGAITHTKYCNDNPNCEEMARSYGLFELRKMAKENEECL
jgi:hypothetical protein